LVELRQPCDGWLLRGNPDAQPLSCPNVTHLTQVRSGCGEMDAMLRKAARTGDVAEARAALDSGAEVDCKSD
jgi:hypothetical protein